MTPTPHPCRAQKKRCPRRSTSSATPWRRTTRPSCSACLASTSPRRSRPRRPVCWLRCGRLFSFGCVALFAHPASRAGQGPHGGQASAEEQARRGARWSEHGDEAGGAERGAPGGHCARRGPHRAGCVAAHPLPEEERAVRHCEGARRARLPCLFSAAHPCLGRESRAWDKLSARRRALCWP